MLAERNRQALKLKDEFFNERNDDYYEEVCFSLGRMQLDELQLAEIV